MKKVAVVILISAAAAFAAEFSLSWSTLDGGGIQESSGGGFKLSATVGQPDPGANVGGGFSLHSGFWAGLVPFGDLIPSLRIAYYLQFPHVFWPATATNWVLQASTNNLLPTWAGITNAPLDVGIERAVPIDDTRSQFIYRLFRP